MGQRPTPIERAIAGEPADRRRRYVERLKKVGIVAVTVRVPVERAGELRELAARWRDEKLRHDD